MSVRVQPCSSRLDAFLNLDHSGFLEMRFKWSKKSNILGSMLIKKLAWTSHIVPVRRRASPRFGVLSPLLNRRSSLFISKVLKLYKQLIRPMMDYDCPVWRHAANSHIRRLQVSIPETRGTQSTSEQAQRSLHQARIDAVQAAHTSHDGLRLPSLESCCQQPHQEAPSSSVQMLAYNYRRTLEIGRAHV